MNKFLTDVVVIIFRIIFAIILVCAALIGLTVAAPLLLVFAVISFIKFVILPKPAIL